MERLPTYFLSHGGGPWPYLNGPFREHYRQLEASLKETARELGGKPRAILVVSGHWEAAEFTVMANPHPGMIYDYSGFPEHTYAVQYSAPGSPELAGRVQGLLAAAGIAARLDETRGFDHGCFAPLAVMYPDADVPVVQLSLKAGYDPQAHLAAGRSLAPLRDEGVLILGSGRCLAAGRPAARAPCRAYPPPAAVARRAVGAARPSAGRSPDPAAGRS